MAFYVLRECGLIHLLVTTFKPSNPPADVLKISSGKRCPVVRVHRGYDANDVDLTDHCCDQSDEIENLIERFDCADLQTSKQSSQESEAEKVFQDMYGVSRITFFVHLTFLCMASGNIENILTLVDPCTCIPVINSVHCITCWLGYVS